MRYYGRMFFCSQSKEECIYVLIVGLVIRSEGWGHEKKKEPHIGSKKQNKKKKKESKNFNQVK